MCAMLHTAQHSRKMAASQIRMSMFTFYTINQNSNWANIWSKVDLITMQFIKIRSVQTTTANQTSTVCISINGFTRWKLCQAMTFHNIFRSHRQGCLPALLHTIANEIWIKKIHSFNKFHFQSCDFPASDQTSCGTLDYMPLFRNDDSAFSIGLLHITCVYVIEREGDRECVCV